MKLFIFRLVTLLLLLIGVRISVAVANAITEPLHEVRQRAVLREVQSHFPIDAKYIENIKPHTP